MHALHLKFLDRNVESLLEVSKVRPARRFCVESSQGRVRPVIFGLKRQSRLYGSVDRREKSWRDIVVTCIHEENYAIESKFRREHVLHLPVCRSGRTLPSCIGVLHSKQRRQQAEASDRESDFYM
jgi:hypothetical protein